MDRYGASEEHQPLTWIGGYPLYAAHAIVLFFVTTMLVVTVMMATQTTPFLSWLMFSSERVLHGEIWRVFTYGWVNPPSLWFAIDMAMIVWFGRELEKHFGRTVFLTLFAGLYLLTPALFTLIGLRWPMQFAGETGSFALFVAFATLYPNALMLFNILAKWAAVALVGIYALIHLSNRDWISLLSLTVTCGFAFGFVRWQQGYIHLPRMTLFRRRPKLRVIDGDASFRGGSGPRSESADTMAEVDALLDKIARSGINSLTAKERAKLDAAREGLRRRADGR